MRARSGAWRCCDWKGRAASVQCELLLAATFSVLRWTPNLHWNVLLGSSKKITSRDHWITAFSQINSVILRDALPDSQRLYANGPFENCQVRMFVKQRALPSANVCEAGLIAKCECFWSSRTDGSSSYLLLKIKQFCSSQNCQLFT